MIVLPLLGDDWRNWGRPLGADSAPIHRSTPADFGIRENHLPMPTSQPTDVHLIRLIIFTYFGLPHHGLTDAMHIGTQLYVAVILLVQAVYAANIIPKNVRCVTAVYTALGYVSFTGEPAVGAWDIRCRNSLMVTSIYAAAEEFCEKDEQTAGFAQLNSYCETVAHTGLLPRENVAENLTDDGVRKMRVVEFHELSRANKINYPVRISPAHYGRTFKTIVRNYYCG